jgi:hypothetical protein
MLQSPLEISAPIARAVTFHLTAIAAHFLTTRARVTLLVRDVNRPDGAGDVLLTQDDLVYIGMAVQQFRDRDEETPHV